MKKIDKYSFLFIILQILSILSQIDSFAYFRNKLLYIFQERLNRLALLSIEPELLTFFLFFS